MRLTAALNVRQFLSRLHPPLPPTRRESSRLQSVLLASFQQHLDQSHPSPKSSDESKPNASTDQVLTIGNTPVDATNTHLQSILNHPLLEKRSTISSNCKSRAARAISVFDAAVLRNKVDITVLEDCIRTYRAALIEDAHNPNLRLGPRIAAWLSATTGSIREDVFTNGHLISQIIELMYRDGAEEVAWEWLRSLYLGQFGSDHVCSRYSKTSYEWLAIEDNFVASMVRETARRYGLVSAAHEYVEACEYRISSGRTLDEASKHCKYQPLYRTGRCITMNILLRGHDHGVSESLYDKILAHRVPLIGNTHAIAAALWPFIPIFHPTKPNAQDLYMSLKDHSYVRSLVTFRGASAVKIQDALLSAILEGANLLLSSGQARQAQRVINVAKEAFPWAFKPKTFARTADKIQQGCNEAVLQPLSGLVIG